MNVTSHLSQFLVGLDLPASFEKALLEEAVLLELPAKGYLVKEGEVCSYIGILLEGSTITYFEDIDKNIFINELNLPVRFVSSYRSFLEQVPSKEYVQANEASNLLVFSIEALRKYRNDIYWLQFFKHISDSFFMRKCAREKALNRLTAKERYHQLLEMVPGVEQRFSQKTISSYLKIRPETLSRMKSLDLHQVKK